MLVKGKTAVVTGSSRGIGRGIALKLAEHGASRIGITYLTRRDEAEQTLAQVRSLGADGFIVQCDVAQPASIAGLFDQARKEFGKLDILVCNARSDFGDFWAPPDKISIEQFDHAFDTQGRAFHLSVRHAIEFMPDGGRIIGITYARGAQMGSWQPWVAMGVGKGAMEIASRYWAVALGKRKITVNMVSPGATDDSVLSRLPPEMYNGIRQWHESGWTPMRRLGMPADIGNAIVLLSSDLAGFITGQTLNVDGGMSVMDSWLPLQAQGVGD